jgi:hypothetical protein
MSSGAYSKTLANQLFKLSKLFLFVISNTKIAAVASSHRLIGIEY